MSNLWLMRQINYQIVNLFYNEVRADRNTTLRDTCEFEVKNKKSGHKESSFQLPYLNLTPALIYSTVGGMLVLNG